MKEIIDNIVLGIGTQSWIGAIALVSGVVYVFLASKGDSRCWLFGIISCVLIAYEDFTVYQLISDGILQIFYVILGVWGVYSWWTGNQGIQRRVHDVPVIGHLFIIVTSLVSGMMLGCLTQNYTQAALPYVDAITTTTAVLTTVLLVKRYRQNWVYWMAINATYLYIYGSREAWFYVALTIIYLVMSVKGWRNWAHLKQTN